MAGTFRTLGEDVPAIEQILPPPCRKTMAETVARRRLARSEQLINEEELESLTRF